MQFRNLGLAASAVLILVMALATRPDAQIGGSEGDQLQKGQWAGPYCLGISCVVGTQGCTGGPADCDAGVVTMVCEGDEIGHASLVPSGAYAGKVLVWTKCHRDSSHGAGGYRTHVWDPDAMGTVLASPDVVEAMSNGIGSRDEGPFCSAHMWMTDGTAQQNAVLFTIGGNVDNSLLGSNAAYWFNASTGLWESTPADVVIGGQPIKLWYPSLLLYLANGAFPPLVLGGSTQVGADCDFGSQDVYQYRQWRTLSAPYATGIWSNHPPTVTLGDYRWHQYPRAFLVKIGNDHFVVMTGHTIVCEHPEMGGIGDPDPNNPYGGSPVQEIALATQAHSAGPDPNPPPGPPPPPPPPGQAGQFPVGGWLYCNAVLMHTLKSYAWAPPGPGTPLDTVYDLNRIIVLGGLHEIWDPALPSPREGPALQYTLELRLDQPAGQQWFRKADALQPRMFGNTVLLPDRTILAVGGQSIGLEGNPNALYRDDGESFDPGTPGSIGVWRSMAKRPLAPGHLSSTPRGYHSVAVLLQDGRVALTGGVQVDTDPLNHLDQINTNDTVDVFQPPYMFIAGRPRITSTTLPVMQYNVPYCLSVNDPSKVDYAVLMGVGSVTHHFDYGQRYVELMTQPNPSDCPGNNLKLLPPPDPALAPEGYYLLFVVDLRSGGQRVPSAQGKFVRLTF